MTWPEVDQQAASPRYPTLDAWVAEWLLPTYRRRLGGHRTWCAQWRDHPEAVDRLTALWATWQKAHDDSAKLAAWWLNVLDPMMTVLLDADGPFSGCRTDPPRHRPPEPWPNEGNP